MRPRVTSGEREGAPGRVLGVDVGEVRVGVAVSDPSRLVASGLATIEGGPDLPARLAALAAEESCHTVVVGLPRSLDGRGTRSTQRAREVADQLAAHGLFVELWDERLSTVEAERMLVEAGRRRDRRRTERDRVAATIILQGWLDAHRQR